MDGLRIAVVGAGPAGFFATAELLARPDVARVDMFDRLPTPYGLVRHGVAPDHQGIKAIARKYDGSAEGAGGRFRLFGNVEIGKDLALEELRTRYHAVVLAFGAQSNRRLGIPGEELPGVHPASVFVGWYNGHPDCVENRYDLSGERAIVIGVGNVGLDVSRVLVKTPAELRATDISDVALAALAENRTREVVLVGRGSLAQATFTPKEVEELAELPGLDLVARTADRALDPVSARDPAALDPRVRQNLELVARHAREEAAPGHRAVRLRFFLSPREIVGDERVRAVRFDVQRAVERNGRVDFEPTGRVEEIACGIVLRAIGYRVIPFPGVPYDEPTASVPHDRGQVLQATGGPAAAGLFVTGWAKRGPSGVIGTNKPDAAETVATLRAAAATGTLPPPRGCEDVEAVLRARGVRFVTFSDWKLLDGIEVEDGRGEGRPRRKFTDVPSMLDALARAKMPSLPHPRLVGTEEGR
jgi:ferredoxin--NADP+ reductase